MNEKLIELFLKCGGGVTIEINPHKAFYLTAKEYFDDLFSRDPKEKAEIENEILDKIYLSNTIISIHFYPHTPIGFYTLYHYDLNLAFEEAFSLLQELKI